MTSKVTTHYCGLSMMQLSKILRTLVALLGLSLALSACGPSDVIELKIQKMSEEDHWSRGGAKTCRVRYQILNNTEHTLNALMAEFVWHDAYDDDVKNPVILQTPLPPDSATRAVLTALMYGSCDDGVQLVGIRNVEICDIDGLSTQECEAKLQVTRVD